VLPSFPRPDVTEFLWTVPLAALIAVGCYAVFAGARALEPVVARRRILLLPAAGLVVGGLAIVFDEITDHGSSQVLFSGQDQLSGLVASASGWSIGALVLVLV
jgi:hypothetical protein